MILKGVQSKRAHRVYALSILLSVNVKANYQPLKQNKFAIPSDFLQTSGALWNMGYQSETNLTPKYREISFARK